MAELGMSTETADVIRAALEKPYGAIVACGPTGSGKTTTLYAALDLLNDPGRVLVTIEDPVEYQMPGVSQIEIDPLAGLTFARGLHHPAQRPRHHPRRRDPRRGDRSH